MSSNPLLISVSILPTTIKVNEKIVHLKKDYSESYLRNSFIQIKIRENGQIIHSFLALKRKKILYLEKKKIIEELNPKNKSEWVEKRTEITEIGKRCLLKTHKKELMYAVEIEKTRLNNPIKEFYVRKVKTVYILLSGSKIIHLIYPEKQHIIFEEITEV